MASLREERARVQTKTFTNWVNSHVRKHAEFDPEVAGASVRPLVGDLMADLADGHVLACLLETLAQKPLAKRIAAPKMRLHKANNLNISLAFCTAEKIRLVNIGAEEIIDANQVIILGLIWTLICHYSISDAFGEMEGGAGGKPAGSAKQQLLSWMAGRIGGESGEDAPRGFDGSKWKDGVFVSSLVKAVDDSLLPSLDEIRQQDDLEALTRAMDVAEECLGVQKLLEPEDFAVADEQAVMAYVSQFVRVKAANGAAPPPSAASSSSDADREAAEAEAQAAREAAAAAEAAARAAAEAADADAAALAKAQADLRECSEKRGLLTEELEAARAALQEARDEADMLRESEETANAAATELREAKAALESELGELKEEADLLRDAEQDAEAARKAAADERDALQQELDELKAAAGSDESRLADVQTQLREAEEAKSASDAEKAALEAKLREAEAAAEEAHDTARSLEEQHGTDGAEKDRLLQEARDAQAAAARDLQAAADAEKAAKADADAQRARADEAEAANAALRDALAKLRDSATAARDERDAAQAAAAAARADADSQRARADEAGAAMLGIANHASGVRAALSRALAGGEEEEEERDASPADAGVDDDDDDDDSRASADVDPLLCFPQRLIALQVSGQADALAADADMARAALKESLLAAGEGGDGGSSGVDVDHALDRVHAEHGLALDARTDLAAELTDGSGGGGGDGGAGALAAASADRVAEALPRVLAAMDLDPAPENREAGADDGDNEEEVQKLTTVRVVLTPTGTSAGTPAASLLDVAVALQGPAFGARAVERPLAASATARRVKVVSDKDAEQLVLEFDTDAAGPAVAGEQAVLLLTPSPEAAAAEQPATVRLEVLGVGGSAAAAAAAAAADGAGGAAAGTEQQYFPIQRPQTLRFGGTTDGSVSDKRAGGGDHDDALAADLATADALLAATPSAASADGDGAAGDGDSTSSGGAGGGGDADASSSTSCSDDAAPSSDPTSYATGTAVRAADGRWAWLPLAPKRTGGGGAGAAAASGEPSAAAGRDEEEAAEEVKIVRGGARHHAAGALYRAGGLADAVAALGEEALRLAAEKERLEAEADAQRAAAERASKMLAAAKSESSATLEDAASRAADDAKGREAAEAELAAAREALEAAETALEAEKAAHKECTDAGAALKARVTQLEEELGALREAAEAAKREAEAASEETKAEAAKRAEAEKEVARLEAELQKAREALEAEKAAAAARAAALEGSADAADAELRAALAEAESKAEERAAAARTAQEKLVDVEAELVLFRENVGAWLSRTSCPHASIAEPASLARTRMICARCDPPDSYVEEHAADLATRPPVRKIWQREQEAKDRRAASSAAAAAAAASPAATPTPPRTPPRAQSARVLPTSRSSGTPKAAGSPRPKVYGRAPNFSSPRQRRTGGGGGAGAGGSSDDAKVMDAMLRDVTKGMDLPHDLDAIPGRSGMYQFGDKKISLRILSGHLVVRVGGGFLRFEEWADRVTKQGVKVDRTNIKEGLGHSVLSGRNHISTRSSPKRG